MKQNFGESSVLNEFARLVGNKDVGVKDAMIKTAAIIPPASNPPAPESTDIEMPKSSDIASAALQHFPDPRKDQEGFRKALAVWANGFVDKIPGSHRRQVQGPVSAFLSNPTPETAQEARGLLNGVLSGVVLLKDPVLTNQINTVLNAVSSAGDWIAKVTKNQMAQKADDGSGVTVMASKDNPAYDVSGETGKDLVDSAHPGNMKTEVTHSKTEENLVETIVERQEKDIEVARKAPKGTYAKLVMLYNDLHKAGHSDKLSELGEAIKALATPEDVLNHMLVALANELDVRGFQKAADRVDEILRKTALGGEDWDVETGTHTKPSSAPPYSGEDVSQMYGAGQQPQSVAVEEPKPISAEEQARRYLETVKVPEEPVKKSPNYDAIMAWQVAFNDVVKATGGYPPIQEDGSWGPECNKAHKFVLDMIGQGDGSINDLKGPFASKMKETIEQGEKMGGGKEHQPTKEIEDYVVAKSIEAAHKVADAYKQYPNYSFLFNMAVKKADELLRMQLPNTPVVNDVVIGQLKKQFDYELAKAPK